MRAIAAHGAALILSNTRAQAFPEYCPATLSYSAVGPKADTLATAREFGLQLRAESARSVDAILAFDTDRGWYTARTTMLLHGDGVAYSPKFFVRFPQPTRINDAFVHQAASSGGSAAGMITCPPPPAGAANNPVVASQSAAVHFLANTALQTPPTAGETIITAKPSEALYTAACANPNAEATVTAPGELNEPPFPLSGAVRSVVSVLVKADGTVGDARIVKSAGLKAFDDAALRAARSSTYAPARAYCRAVPATYLFMVTFTPDG